MELPARLFQALRRAAQSARHALGRLRRNPSRRAARGAALLAASLLTASCKPGPPPLRVGIPLWAPAGFALVARDLGFFDERDIELVQYSSPIELQRHLREGSLDAAALTLDFAPYLASSFPSLDVVFVIDFSQGAAGIVALPEIADLAGLAGRRIGVEASPLGAHLLLRALKAGGLAARDIETISIDSEDQVDAFLSRRVDAVVSYEPDRSRLLSGGASSLFDSARTPGLVVDVLVVPTATAAERAGSLRKLLDAWLAAFARVKDDRAGTVARLASNLSVDPPAVERALAGVRLADLATNRDMLAGPSPKLATTLKEIEGLAVAAGLLRADARRPIRIDASYLPQVVSRPVGTPAGVAPK